MNRWALQELREDIHDHIGRFGRRPTEYVLSVDRWLVLLKDIFSDAKFGDPVPDLEKVEVMGVRVRPSFGNCIISASEAIQVLGLSRGKSELEIGCFFYPVRPSFKMQRPPAGSP